MSTFCELAAELSEVELMLAPTPSLEEPLAANLGLASEAASPPFLA